MKLKICGMREPENIRKVAELKPDYMGFIFYPQSKRFAEPLDASLVIEIGKSIKTTGVFVNASEEDILKACSSYNLKAVQLHGNESPELAKRLKAQNLEVIKVFLLDKNASFEIMEPYLNVCDHFLFDTKSDSHGGSGVAFDWSILEQYPYSKTFFLSGGISLENLEQIKSLAHLPIYGIDVNSKFEVAPGLKNVELLQQLRWRLS